MTVAEEHAHDDTQGVDVAARIDILFTRKKLGRGVCRSTTERTGQVMGVIVGKAEVNETHIVVGACNKDILWFNVIMDYPCAMYVCHCLKQLHEHPAAHCRRGVLSYEISQRTTVDILHDNDEEVVFNLTEEQFAKLVIAYEPVWAIGTGKTATAEQAEEIHAYIREVLRSKFGAAAEECAILYGGSCKPSNAGEIFSKENVDGGLIGGAALKAEDFLGIGKAF